MSRLFVNGTLMRGLSLHQNLAGATCLGTFRTAAAYRVHSIADIHPGMYRVEQGGYSIEGELYEVPPDVLDRVVRSEPPGLYVGDIELDDGTMVPGILFSRHDAIRHPDISHFGGWRAYIES
jgi:AGZA family xanthine/uracil permease-like MFS transporter